MKTEFTVGSVGIRRFGLADAAPLFEAVSETKSDLTRWMAWCKPGYSRNHSAAYVAERDANWKKGQHYSFVIYDVKTGELLGSVGINCINHFHRFANLGYWVRAERANRGIATAAVKLAARFGMGELQLNRLEIVTAIKNRASQRVAEKAGARREGVLRNRLVIQGKSHDAVIFSLTTREAGSGVAPQFGDRDAAARRPDPHGAGDTFRSAKRTMKATMRANRQPRSGARR